MNEKFSLKIIQHGKTQQTRLVQSGAGIAGQAVVIQATDAARYQLVNVVTLVSPAKLQLKRLGDALHLALPGGDINAPDLVIQDYFKVTGASLQGSAISGEWMIYETANLATHSAMSGTDAIASASAEKVSNVSLGGEGALSTFTQHPWWWTGGIVGVAAAAAGGGGGGGSSSSSAVDATPLSIIQTYAAASAGVGVTVPTLATYKSAGVKALANLSETTASADIDSAAVTTAMGTTWLTAINSAVDKRTDGSTLTVAQLQALVDSYYRILSEADSTSTDTIVYPRAGISNPTVTDYVNIGASVGNAKSVDLLNDVVGQSAKTAVDTVDELNVIAKAAYNVMLQAGVNAGSASAPAAYTSDNEWVAGLTAMGITGVTTSSMTAIKALIAGTSTAGTANDGLEVDTVQEIKDLLKPLIAQQVLREYTDTNGFSTAPTLSTYADAGIKTFKSLTDTGISNRKNLNDSSTASGAESNTFLTAAILNTALDKLAGSSLTYDATYSGTVQKMVDSYYRILREADGKYAGDGVTYTTLNPADTDVYNDSPSNATSDAFNDPTLADYANIGITVADAISATTYVATPSGNANAGGGVGNETLDLLNDAIGRLVTTSVDTVAEIETLAITANDVMLLAKGANTSASQTDTNLIAGLNNLLGLNSTNGVNTNNIAAMKDAIVATADTGLEVDTASELLSLLGLVRLQTFTDDGAAIGAKTVATPTLNDWSVLNLTANTSLTDDTNITPLNTATYWKNTNPINGLNALNSALDTYTSTQLGTFNGSVMSNGILQAIVDSYGRILQEADGSRATDTDVSKISDITSPANLSSAKDVLEQDLINVGVKSGGVNGSGTGIFYSFTGELLASSIGSLASTAVDTVAELNNLVDIAENVMKQAEGGAGVSYTSDAQWVTALTSLGVTGATSSNISAIKTAIDTANATGVDTYDELQAIVSLVRVNDYAALSSGYALPTLADYQILTQEGAGNHAYTDAKSSYLNAYNDAINFKPSVKDATEVENMVVAYNLILDSADGNRAATTSEARVSDYANFGVTVNRYSTVTAETTATTLDNIISGLNIGNVDTVAEVQMLESIVGKIMLMAANTKKTNETVGVGDYVGLSQTDLGLLGLKGSDNGLASSYNVTGAALARFNSFVIYSDDMGAGVNDFTKLQTLLNNAIVAA